MRLLKTNGVKEMNSVLLSLEARIEELEKGLAKPEAVKAEPEPSGFDWRVSDDIDALKDYAKSIGAKFHHKSGAESIKTKIEETLKQGV